MGASGSLRGPRKAPAAYLTTMQSLSGAVPARGPLLDSNANASGGISFNHGTDLLAVSHHYESEFQSGATVGGNDLRCSRAVGIHSIRACCGPPVASCGNAVYGSEIHLPEIPAAIELRHSHSPEQAHSGTGKDLAIYGESVRAAKSSERAISVIARLCPGEGA